MESIVNKITQKTQDSLSTLKAKSDELQNQALELMNKGLTVEASKITNEKIAPIIGEYERIQREANQEIESISRKSLEGIASGESISDKETRKQYVPSYGMPGVPSSYEQPVSIINNKKLAGEISNFTGKDVKKINVTDGLSYGRTINLEGLGDQVAQLELLQQKYPNKVIPLTVAGKNNFLVEDEEGISRLVFPTGIQGKDVVATATTEAPALIAGGTAAIAAAGPSYGTASIPAFNVAYETTKAAQTAAYRGANEVEMRPGQIATQAAIGATVGTALDYALLGGSKFVKNKMLTEGVDNLIETDLRVAQANLNRAGINTEYPFTASSGQSGLDFYNRLAGQFPNSPLGRRNESSRQALAGFMDTTINKSKGEIPKQVVQKIDTDLKNLQRIARSSDVRIQNSVKNSTERAFSRIAVDPIDQIEAGKMTADIVTQAKNAITEKKNQAFSGFEDSADKAGLVIQPERFAKAIEDVVLNSKVARNPKIDNLLLRLSNAPTDAQQANILRQQIAQMENSGQTVSTELKLQLRDLEAYSQPFGAKAARDLIDEVRQLVPDVMVGTGRKDLISADSADAVEKVLRNEVDKVGLTQQWDEVKSVYGDEFVPFREGQLGQMSRDQFGKLQMSPEKIVKTALADSASINSVLKGVRDSGDEAGYEQLKNTFQKAYLQELGFSNNKAVGGKLKDPDPAKMQALFGLRADYVTKNINDLNKLTNVDVANISQKDAMALTELMPEVEKRKLFKSIAVRDQAIKEEDKLAQNLYIKQIKGGNIDLLDNEAVLKSLQTARTTDVLEIAQKLPPQIRKDFGTDMMAVMFKQYSDTSNRTRLGQPLWDHNKFNKDIGSWTRGKPNAPNIVQKLDAISGSGELADLFISASKNLSAVTPTGEPLYQTLRTMASPGQNGGLAFKIYSTLEYPLQWTLASAYGSNTLKPFLKSLSKNISEETYRRNTDMLIKSTVATSAGIKLAAEQARNDPEFAQQFPEILRIVKEESIKSLETQQK
jgi:hypothetical protein